MKNFEQSSSKNTNEALTADKRDAITKGVGELASKQDKKIVEAPKDEIYKTGISVKSHPTFTGPDGYVHSLSSDPKKAAEQRREIMEAYRDLRS